MCCGTGNGGVGLAVVLYDVYVCVCVIHVTLGMRWKSACQDFPSSFFDYRYTLFAVRGGGMLLGDFIWRRCNFD